MCKTAPRPSRTIESGRTVTPTIDASDIRHRRHAIPRQVGRDLIQTQTCWIGPTVVSRVPCDGSPNRFVEVPARMPPELALRLLDRQAEECRFVAAAVARDGLPGSSAPLANQRV